jgi:hypothetical protein
VQFRAKAELLSGQREHQEARRPLIGNRAGRRIGLKRISYESDCSFFIRLKKTLQRQDFDLTVVTIDPFSDGVLKSHHNEQSFSLTSPTGAWKAFDQTL